MDSTSPAKSQSQSLHNFDLLNLKWKTEGNSSGSITSRRRPTKSPAPSASPVLRLPSCDSVSAPPPRLQSPLGSSAKQIPVRGESFKPPSICERYWKSALVSGDPGRLVNGHSSLEAEGSKKIKDAPIEFRVNNNHRNFASGTMRPCPLGIDQKKPRETGVNLGNLGKNKNPVEVNPLKEPLKILHKGEYYGKDEVQGDGNTANEETRVWELRPRNPKHKAHNTCVGDKEKKEMEEKKNSAFLFHYPKQRSRKIYMLYLDQSLQGDLRGGQEHSEKFGFFVSWTLACVNHSRVLQGLEVLSRSKNVMHFNVPSVSLRCSFLQASSYLIAGLSSKAVAEKYNQWKMLKKSYLLFTSLLCLLSNVEILAVGFSGG